jgi:hypothetical protein
MIYLNDDVVVVEGAPGMDDGTIMMFATPDAARTYVARQRKK